MPKLPDLEQYIDMILDYADDLIESGWGFVIIAAIILLGITLMVLKKS